MPAETGEANNVLALGGETKAQNGGFGGDAMAPNIAATLSNGGVVDMNGNAHSMSPPASASSKRQSSLSTISYHDLSYDVDLAGCCCSGVKKEILHDIRQHFSCLSVNIKIGYQ